MQFALPNIRGELFALSTAFLWAISTVIYGRAGKHIPSMEMNLWKCLVGGAIAFLTLIITGITPSLGKGTDYIALGLLIVSGIIGIGLGDSVYFESMRYIGARQASLLKTISPPLAGIIAWVFLGEKLSSFAWLGILLIVLGVAWVVTERKDISNGDTPAATYTFRVRGVLLGLLSALTEASGVVLSHTALIRANINPMQGTMIRLVSGGIFVLIIIAARRQVIGRWFNQPFTGRLIIIILVAIFTGSYLGIWFQQSSLRLISAGIAQTLIATTPLFILPIVAFLGEKINLRAILGALVALAGVAILFIL
jgi:drug/metabolite transporter (DMT)-like permease